MKTSPIAGKATHTTTGWEARVYRDAEWQEWRVRFYQDGQHLAEADYHTDDKGDAQFTARAWAWRKAKNH